MVWQVLVVILAYFLGAIPSGYWVGKKICDVNILELGSKNVGATNTFRILGPKIGGLVLLMDLLKGFIAALIGYFVGGVTLSVICGVVAILAHTFSVFLKFKGGKGVATGAGVMFCWNPLAILCALIVWSLLAFTTGYVSLASLIASIACVFFLWFFGGTTLQIVICALIVVYIVWKHRANIKRLLDGTENKMNWKEKFSKK